MSTLREAGQQALEACTDTVMGWQSLAPLSVRSAAMESLDALRDALAQEEQEPVAEKLEAVNAELLKALNNIEVSTYDAMTAALARAAIAKARGKT